LEAALENVAYEGQILAGKYRVDRVLGVGGMGVVVAAHHLELDARVAIKFLLPETLGNPDAVARFAREARAAVRIRSEHVARVSDVGKLESGAPYMVMEYLEGLDLSGWLSERGPLPFGQAVEFALQASEAIAEAHALGIVHRDLKPANLFVIKRPDGGLSIKVLDFGISKTTGMGGSGSDGAMTKTSAMLGSPLYMSPEQIQSSKDVDARSDIWALGVILYELITGVAPFGGEHMAELIFAIISAQPRPMRSFRPDVPEGLERVIGRCLAKNRAERFASVAEMAGALAPFAPQRSQASLERITGVASGGAPARDLATVAIGAAVDTASRYAAAGTQASWGNTNERGGTSSAAMVPATTKAARVWLIAGVGGLAVVLAGGILLARGVAPAATPAAAAAASELVHSASSPAASEPPHPTPASVSEAASASAPPTTSSSAVAEATPPAPSAAPKSAATVKAKPKTPNVPLAPRDPWGGSQH
jgi:hypothetical protein